jgi:hypothetical protein
MPRKLWKNTDFLKAENWPLKGFLVVILGEEAVMIQFLKRMTTKPMRQLAHSLKMYTVHFLYALSPWGGSGYDPVPDKKD